MNNTIDLNVPYTENITEESLKTTKEFSRLIRKRHKECRAYLKLKCSNPIPPDDRVFYLNSIYEGSPYTFTNHTINTSSETHKVNQHCKIHNTTHIRVFRDAVCHGVPPCCLEEKKTRQIGCGFGKKITDEFFKEQLSALFPHIKLISPYIRANTPATFYCETCGYTWNKKPAALIRNTRWGCPNCHRIEIENRSDNKHSIHIERKNKKKKIKERYRKFMEENPIPWKDGYRHMTNEYYIAGIKACREDWDNYTYDKVDIVNQHIKITITCKKHGDFQMLPNSFRYGCDCPVCAKYKYTISSGEQQLLTFFEENKIEFEFQKSFEDCKDKKLLLFDFMVYLKDRAILVEYDGVQHFGEVSYWDEAGALDKRKQHDNMKAEYAKTHNIPLYRITLDQYVTDGWVSMKDFKEMVLSKL